MSGSRRLQPLRNAAAGQQQGPQFGPEIDPQMGAPADQIDEPGAEQEVHGANEDVAPNVDENPIAEEVDNLTQEEKNKRNRQLLLQNALDAHTSKQTDIKYAEALVLMYQQSGVINLEIPEIVSMDFSKSEIDILLKKYIANPLQEETANNAVQSLEGIECLSKPITADDAIRVKTWSDRYADQKVDLKKNSG